MRAFTAILRTDEDGFIVAEAPELVGCVTQGRTRAEALASLREAISLCLEDSVPSPVEVTQVAC